MNDESAAPTQDGQAKPNTTVTLKVWFLLVLGTIISAFGFPLVLLLLLPLAFSTAALEQPK